MQEAVGHILNFLGNLDVCPAVTTVRLLNRGFLNDVEEDFERWREWGDGLRRAGIELQNWWGNVIGCSPP